MNERKRIRQLVACWTIALAAATAAGLAAVRLQGPIPTPHRAGTALRNLAACEEVIVRSPFVPRTARSRVARKIAQKLTERKHTLHALLPTPVLGPDEGQMGWAQPDREYWDRLPLPLKRIPADWSRLPCVRFTSAEVGGTREIRLNRQAQYDQWLLKDFAHDLTAWIGIDRATHCIYFTEVSRQKSGEWTYKPAFDNCYRCHPSGPRVIRPLAEAGVDRHILKAFNLLLLSYGACDFGDTVNSTTRGGPLADPRCDGCHDGVRRGRLYDIHMRSVLYKTQDEATMPPPPQNRPCK